MGFFFQVARRLIQKIPFLQVPRLACFLLLLAWIRLCLSRQVGLGFQLVFPFLFFNIKAFITLFLKQVYLPQLGCQLASQALLRVRRYHLLVTFRLCIILHT